MFHFLFTFRSELYLLCDIYIYICTCMSRMHRHINFTNALHVPEQAIPCALFFSFLLAHQDGKAMRIL